MDSMRSIDGCRIEEREGITAISDERRPLDILEDQLKNVPKDSLFSEDSCLMSSRQAADYLNIKYSSMGFISKKYKIPKIRRLIKGRILDVYKQNDLSFYKNKVENYYKEHGRRN